MKRSSCISPASRPLSWGVWPIRDRWAHRKTSERFEIKIAEATMISKRREFLSRIAASGLALQTCAKEAAASRNTIRGVAFDAFPILDPRPVFSLAQELYPEMGVDL